MPAASGTMGRARLRMPVSRMPSTAPARPTAVANAGAAMPEVVQITAKQPL
jgi:hypothetical protein